MSPRGGERNARGACLCPRPGAGARPLQREGSRPRARSGQPGAVPLVRVDEDASPDRPATGGQVPDRRHAGGAGSCSAVRLIPGAAACGATTAREGANEACGGQATASSSSFEQVPPQADARRSPHRHGRGLVPGQQASRRRPRALRSARRRDDLHGAVGPVPRRYTSARLGLGERKGGPATRRPTLSNRLTSERRRRS
jgi:hypothetical protein